VSITPRRRYNNSRRRADAEVRQRRIVEAAAALFVDQGFAATSIDQIAGAADVSPQTVYATYGSKAAVLSRAIEVAVLGDFEAVPLADRLPVLADMSSGQHQMSFAAAAHFVRLINERVAPLMRVLEQSAATDPGLEELRQKIFREIRLVGPVWITQLGSALSPGLTVAEAADMLLTVHSPYVYSTLTVDLGWTPDRFEQWLADAMPRLLLRPELLSD
jgi:AcrR family transcriptional regulator